MRKSRPKTASQRPNSTKKNKNDNQKMNFNTTKKLTFQSQTDMQFMTLQKEKLLPILNSYEPHILKHILLAGSKFSTIQRISKNSGDCELHSIKLKTMIGYFTQWKKNVKNKIKSFENLLVKVNLEQLRDEDIKQFKLQLVDNLNEALILNTMIKKKLQSYVDQEAINYIQSRLQQHVQNPIHRPQPMGKEHIQLKTHENHSKISYILQQFQNYQQLIHAILEIFTYLNQITTIDHLSLSSDQKQTKNKIIFEDLQKLILEGKQSLVQSWMLRKTQQLWPLLSLKIKQAYTFCMSRQSNRYGQTSSDTKKLANNFFVENKLANKTSRNSTSLKRSKSIKNQKYQKYEKQYKLSSNIIDSQSQVINLNLVEFKLKKLLPLMIRFLIGQIRRQVHFQKLLLQFNTYFKTIINEMNNRCIMIENITNDGDSKGELRGIKKVRKEFIRFEKTISSIYTQIESYNKMISEQMNESNPQHQEIHKMQEKNSFAVEKILQQITSSKTLLNISLQLYFVRMLSLYNNTISQQDSILYLIKDEGKLYKELKQLILMTTKILSTNLVPFKKDNQQSPKFINTGFTTLLASALREYSPLFIQLLEKEVDLKIIKKSNFSRSFTNSQSIIQCFEEVKDVVKQFNERKEKIIMFLRDSINQYSSKVLPETNKIISSSTIQATQQKLTVEILKQRSGQFQQQMQKQIQLKNFISETKKNKELQSIEHFIQLLRFSELQAPNISLLKQPQQFFNKLKVTGLDLLINPQFVSEIGMLRNKQKQYESLIAQNQLIQYVIQKPQLNVGIMGLIVEDKKMMNHQQTVNKDEKKEKIEEEKEIGGKLMFDVLLGKMSISKKEIVTPKQQSNISKDLLIFPKVPILASPQSIFSNLIQNPNKLMTQNNSPLIINHQQLNQQSLPQSPLPNSTHISQIILQRQLILGFSILQQIRQLTYKLNKKVGYTIDDLSQLQQMQIFNDVINQKIASLQNLRNGSLIVNVINEMIKVAVRQWDKMMKRNSFTKSIDVDKCIKMWGLCDDEKLRTVGVIKEVSEYFVKMLEKSKELQPIIASQKQLIKDINVEILHQIVNSLNNKQFQFLKTCLRKLLKNNSILVSQYQLRFQTNNHLVLHKIQNQELNQIREKELSKASKLIIIQKQVNSKKINNSQSDDKNIPFKEEKGGQKQSSIEEEVNNKNRKQNNLLELFIPQGNSTNQQPQPCNHPNTVASLKISQEQLDKLILKIVPSVVMVALNKSDKKQLQKISSVQTLMKQLTAQNLQYLQYYDSSLQSAVNQCVETIESLQVYAESVLKSIDELNLCMDKYVKQISKIIMDLFVKDTLTKNNSYNNNGDIVKIVGEKINTVLRQWVLKFIQQRSSLTLTHSKKLQPTSGQFYYSQETHILQSKSSKENKEYPVFFTTSIQNRDQEKQTEQKNIAQSQLCASQKDSLLRQLSKCIQLLSIHSLSSYNYSIICLKTQNSSSPLFYALTNIKNKSKNKGNTNTLIEEGKQSCMQLISKYLPGRKRQTEDNGMLRNNQLKQYQTSSNQYDNCVQVRHLNQFWFSSTTNPSQYQSISLPHQNLPHILKTTFIVVNLEQLLYQFILNHLVFNHGLTLLVQSNILNLNKQRQSPLLSLLQQITQFINLSQSDISEVPLNKSKAKQSVYFNAFVSAYREVMYFYQVHYKTFRNYANSVVNGFSQRDKNQLHPQIQEKQVITEMILVQEKIQRLKKIWGKVYKLYMSIFEPNYRQANSAKNIREDNLPQLNMDMSQQLPKYNERMQYLHTLIKQMLINEDQIITIIGDKLNVREENIQLLNQDEKYLQQNRKSQLNLRNIHIVTLKQKNKNSINNSKNQPVGVLLYVDNNKYNTKDKQNSLNLVNSNQISLSHVEKFILTQYFWNSTINEQVKQQKQGQNIIASTQYEQILQRLGQEFIRKWRQSVQINSIDIVQKNQNPNSISSKNKQQENPILFDKNRNNQNLSKTRKGSNRKVYIREIECIIREKFIVVDLFSRKEQIVDLRKHQQVSYPVNRGKAIVQIQRLQQFSHTLRRTWSHQDLMSQLQQQIEEILQYSRWKQTMLKETGIMESKYRNRNNHEIRRLLVLEKVVKETEDKESLFNTDHGLLLETQKKHQRDNHLLQLNGQLQSLNYSMQKPSIFQGLNLNSLINQHINNQQKNNHECNKQDFDGSLLFNLTSNVSLVSKVNNKNDKVNSQKEQKGRGLFDILLKECQVKKDWSNSSQINTLNSIVELTKQKYQFLSKINKMSAFQIMVHRIFKFNNFNQSISGSNVTTQQDCFTEIYQLFNSIFTEINYDQSTWWLNFMTQLNVSNSGSNHQSNNTQTRVITESLFVKDEQFNTNLKKFISSINHQIVTIIEKNSWTPHNDKFSPQRIQQDINSISQIVYQFINHLRSNLKKQIFIQLNQLPQPQHINVQANIIFQPSNISRSKENNQKSVMLSSRQEQLQVLRPFTFHNIPLINEDNLDNQESSSIQFTLLERVFCSFIEKHVLSKKYMQLWTQLTEDIDSQTKQLQSQLRQLYSLIDQEERNKILEWRDKRSQQQTNRRQSKIKENTLKILFDIIINWSLIIEKQRQEAKRRKKRQQEAQLDEEFRRQRQRNQKLKREKQRQPKNYIWKQKAKESQTESQLQISFALSDAWQVDIVDFISQLSQTQRKRFHKVQDKLQRDRINKLECELQISVNLSEDNLQQQLEDTHPLSRLAKSQYPFSFKPKFRK